MGRKDDYGHSNIDKYRKQLGKQEFKGRNKKNTLLAKNKAQSRISGGSLLQTLLLYSMAILVLLVGIYALFFFMLEAPTKKQS